MSKGLKYLIGLIFSLHACYSLPFNDTNLNNATLSKRSFKYGPVGLDISGDLLPVGMMNTMGGRQASVGLTYALTKLLGESGIISINIWNEMANNMDAPKWGNNGLTMEAPPPAVLYRNHPAQAIIAYYPRYVTRNGIRRFWVSYKMREGDDEARLCIYTRINWSGYVYQTPIFKYIIFVIRTNEICNDPDPTEANFVQENANNGYRSDWVDITCKSAFASNGAAYTLNAYISRYTVSPQNVIANNPAAQPQLQAALPQLQAQNGNGIQQNQVNNPDQVQPAAQQEIQNQVNNPDQVQPAAQQEIQNQVNNPDQSQRTGQHVVDLPEQQETQETGGLITGVRPKKLSEIPRTGKIRHKTGHIKSKLHNELGKKRTSRKT